MLRYLQAVFAGLILPINLWSDADPNPFSPPRPLMQPLDQKATETVPSKLDPKQKKVVEESVLFKGYYVLGDGPRFFIYNTQEKFGEWVKLSETTEEGYKVLGFDDNITVTLLHERNHYHFDLLLEKASREQGGSTATSPKASPAKSSTASSTPKKMEPKPDFTPPIPPEVEEQAKRKREKDAEELNNIVAGNPSEGVSGASRSSSSRGVPYGIFPNMGVGGISGGSSEGSRPTQSPGIATGAGTSGKQSIGSSSGRMASLRSRTPGASSSPTGASTVSTGVNQSEGDGGELDLSTLPAPPPPPDITPPGPPPDIIPYNQNE